MNIQTINFNKSYDLHKKENSNQNPVQEREYPKTELRSKFNDHLVSFGARVDKGMNRFFNVNKDVMPKRVRDLVEPLPNREIITPLEAQYYAYMDIEDAETVDDIKTAYPDEELFKDLKPASQSKAPTGILYSMREVSEIYPDGVLNSKDDMTVYLTKKIFLESKTLDEINKDLEDDLDPDFKVEYKRNNPDSRYVHPSTLNALGVKMPNSKYMQSLRYTRDGYSDAVGVKIRKGLNDFMSSLTPEQRTARAVKKVREFEKWWAGLTRNEKIDMIAKNEAELEMLKSFKKDKRENDKRLKEAGIDIESKEDKVENPEKKTPRTKVGSHELKNDDLFKAWAGLNLKKFKEGMSQAELDTFHLRQMANQVRRWKEMTPAERTDYISKMKAGSEPVRYTMIDAWNNSPEIIKSLYHHLKDSQVYKPVDIVYSSEEFSKFQSNVMTEFWDKNPDYASKLGDRILDSREKVERAVNNGTFETLKQDINRNKNIRKKEMEEYKKSLEKPVEEPKVESEYIDYKQELLGDYQKGAIGNVNSVPRRFKSDVFEQGLKTLPEDTMRLLTKSLTDDLSFKEKLEFNQEINGTKTPEIARAINAYDMAMADSLYNATKEPKVYKFSTSQITSGIYQLERGAKTINIDNTSDKDPKQLKVDEKFKGIDKNRVNQLYETYKKDLPDEDVEDIIDYNCYFNETTEENRKAAAPLREKLSDYVKSYGRAINLANPDKSAYPDGVVLNFGYRFLEKIPMDLYASDLFKVQEPLFIISTKVKELKSLYGHAYSFLPKDVINDYMHEASVLDEIRKPNRMMQEPLNSRLTISPIDSLEILTKDKVSNNKTKCKLLAIEQAMADTLYSVCGDENVYKLGYERLADQLGRIQAKVPVNRTYKVPAVDGSMVNISINKRPNLNMVKRGYDDYMKDISGWIKDNSKSDKPDYEELLFILNPEEDNPVRDRNVKERMAAYFPELSELDFSDSGV